VLAFCGGLLGVFIAYTAVPLLARLIPASLPVTEVPTIDARVILFALSITTLTGLGFGVIPSIRAASTSNVEGLREGGREGIGGKKERLRSGLVVAEIALSLVLLVSSGLLIRALWQLQQVGLGYLRLGQPATTLSGGEAQRLKVARELALANKHTGKKLYVMDEPTTGLHLDDIRKLAQVFNRLVDAGHTLVLIEHNLDVIKLADWVIDLGPEAGDRGGEVVASGRPEDVARVEASHTGQWLRTVLPGFGEHDARRPRRSPAREPVSQAV